MDLAALKHQYAFVSFLTCVTTLFLSGFVYAKGKKSQLSRLYSFWAFCVGLWSYFLVLNIYAVEQRQALLWCRMLHVWAIILPAVYLHFALLFLDKYGARRYWVHGLYLLTGILVIFNFTPWFLTASFRPQFNFFITEPGPLYPLHVITFVGTVLYVLLELVRSLGPSSGEKRKQIQYFLIATLVGYSGGVTNYLINYNYLLIPFYPYGNYTILVYVAVIGLGIVKYKLMDIEVVIKKTLVFTGLLTFFVGTVSIIVYLLNTSLGRLAGINQTVSTGIALVAAMLLYEPVKNLLILITDRYLFQKKEDFRTILNRLSENIITILDLDQVARTILETFRESLRIDAGAIILKNEHGYRILNSFGLDPATAGKTYAVEDSLMSYFKTHQQIAHLESEEGYRSIPAITLSEIQALKAAVAAPLFLHGELIGLLTLGKRKSDQEYLLEEIEYFPTVAGQVAIALSNARLYAESLESRKKIEAMQLELIHREKMAFVSDLVKGIAHEIFNPLLPVFHTIEELDQDISVELFDIFEGIETRLDEAHRKRYLRVLKELRAATRTLNTNSQHIHLVIDTLNKMQKEDSETIGPMDFKTFLKDSRSLIAMELHHEGTEIPVEEDAPRGLPPVKGNPTLLKQVFVNLFKNSVHAMSGRPGKKISIRAAVEPGEPRFLKVDFTDTGAGIPAEVVGNIFDFGFTTKKEKGQGIGLNQCKLIVEKIGGSIACTSQPGRGTTFTLRLPVWQESP